MGGTPLDSRQALAQARAVLDAELQALARLSERLDDAFVRAVEAVLSCTGKVVVAGVGKSGMAARKLAATFSSTGTPAVFLHAGEALHGDLGLLRPEDVLILISHSGESDEVVRLLPAVATIGPTVVAFTGAPDSRIGKASDIVLDCGVEREADPLNLAPTASAIAAQALGDALAIVVAAHKQLTPEQFALSHPGGALGRRLTVRVEHLMHGGAEQPIVRPDTPMREVVVEMTSKALGAVNVIDGDGLLVGIITDGDLRRGLQKHDNLLALRAGDLMTRNPIRVQAGTMAIDALHLMEDRPRQIMVLPVVDTAGKAVGLLRVHDIVKAGL